MPKLQRMFPYYGSKISRIKHYPKPQLKHIFEPFAGSATYSLTYHWHDVTLCDVSPYVVGVWDYLINVKESEFAALPTEFYSTDELVGIPVEAKWFISFWCNHTQIKPLCKVRSDWQYEWPKGYWSEYRRDYILHNNLPLVRHWKVYQCSYADIGNGFATWFIDPPYSDNSGKFYAASIDYTHLSEWIKGRQGQVISCGKMLETYLPFEGPLFIAEKKKPEYKQHPEGLYHQPFNFN